MLTAEKHSDGACVVDRRAENRRIRKDRRATTAPPPISADGLVVFESVIDYVASAARA